MKLIASNSIIAGKSVAAEPAPNPLLSIVKEGMESKGIHHVCLPSGPNGIDMSEVEKVFGAYIFHELGNALLQAMIKGDTEFPQIVRDAIKGCDELFHRDREKDLLQKAFKLFSEWPEPVPKGNTAKERLTKELGRKLTASQWKRLAKALRIEGKRGRPVK